MADAGNEPGGQPWAWSAPRRFPSVALESVRAETDQPIMVDLSGITFCDSSGLSSLIWAHGNEAVLASSSPYVLRLIDITCLTEHTEGTLAVRPSLPRQSSTGL